MNARDHHNVSAAHTQVLEIIFARFLPQAYATNLRAIGGTVSEAQCRLADQKLWAFVGPPKVGPRQDHKLPWWAHETQQECQIVCRNLRQEIGKHQSEFFG